MLIRTQIGYFLSIAIILFEQTHSIQLNLIYLIVCDGINYQINNPIDPLSFIQHPDYLCPWNGTKVPLLLYLLHATTKCQIVTSYMFLRACPLLFIPLLFFSAHHAVSSACRPEKNIVNGASSGTIVQIWPKIHPFGGGKASAYCTSYGQTF